MQLTGAYGICLHVYIDFIFLINATYVIVSYKKNKKIQK